MPSSESPASRFYSQEDVQQILNVAIAQQNYEGEFSHDQLLEIAAEMEIPATVLRQAEQIWQHEQSGLQRRQAFNRYRKARLKRRAGRYLIVNTGLCLLNGFTGFSFLWFPFLALPWGIMLGLNVWNVCHTQGDAYERAFQRWNRKRLVGQWFQARAKRLFPG